MVVYTGRHGGQVGQATAGDLLLDKYKEFKFVEEDITSVYSTLASSTGVLFSVKDADKAPYDDIIVLRQHIDKDVQQGHLVILAWCYSLLSMFEFPVTMPKVLRDSFAENYR